VLAAVSYGVKLFQYFMANLELIQLSYYSITDASYREDLDWLFSILVEGLKDKNISLV
jgi:hypothetical protein